MTAVAIAFEGCACRAAFHAGVAETMEREGITLAAASGASSGAVIAVAVAAGHARDLPAWWMELLGTPVLRPGNLWRGRWPLCMSEIVGGALEAHFAGRRMSEIQRPLAIVVSHWRGRKLEPRVVTHRDAHRVTDVVLGSCFYPGPYHRRIWLDGRLCLDGAMAAKTPVAQVHALRPGKLIACVSKPDGIVRRAEFDPAPVDISRYDYRVICPAAPLPVGMFDFDRERTMASFAAGRRAAQEFLRRESRWLGG